MIRKFKLAVPALAIVCIVAIVVFLGHRANGQTLVPSTMSMQDAATLHAELAELRILQIQEEPHKQKVVIICARSKIDPSEIGKTVGVDFDTGAIVRQPAQAPPGPHR